VTDIALLFIIPINEEDSFYNCCMTVIYFFYTIYY